MFAVVCRRTSYLFFVRQPRIISICTRRGLGATGKPPTAAPQYFLSGNTFLKRFFTLHLPIFINQIYYIFPSMTFVFKTASHGGQLCGRVTASHAVGFHQVFESKSESLVIPLCLAFCTLRFVVRLRRQGFFSRHAQHRLPSRPIRKAHGPQGTFVLLLFSS